jgi:hypothetical protein
MMMIGRIWSIRGAGPQSFRKNTTEALLIGPRARAATAVIAHHVSSSTTITALRGDMKAAPRDTGT